MAWNSWRQLFTLFAFSSVQGAGLGWTLSTIGGLQEKAATLNDERVSSRECDGLLLPTKTRPLCIPSQAAREERIGSIGRNITTLWGRLSTPQEEQTAFMESHCGLGDSVILAVSLQLDTPRAHAHLETIALLSAWLCSARRTSRA
jgi:hypothetical protein